MKGKDVLKEIGRAFGIGENPYISRRGLTALGASSVAAVVLIVAAGPNRQSEAAPASSANTSTIPLPDMLASCPQPSEASIQRVDDIMNQSRFQLEGEVANARVQMFDGIGWAGNTMEGENDAGSIYWGNQFLKRYGVKLKIGFGDKQTHRNMQTPTPADLDHDYAFSNLARGVVEGFSSVPAKLVAFSELKQVRAVYSKGGWQWRVEYPNTIDWNVRKYMFVDDVVNEIGIPLGYLAEQKICGPKGMNTDPGFEKLNGTSIYKDEGQKSDYSVMSDVWGREYQMTNSRYDGARGNRKAKENYCANWKGLKSIAANTVAVDRISLKNVAADKARLWQMFTAPWGAPDILGQDSPYIKSKAEYMLAQLGEKAGFGAVEELALQSTYYPVNADPRIPTDNVTGQYKDPELTHPALDC